MRATWPIACLVCLLVPGFTAGSGHEQTLKEALSQPSRPEQDRARDAGRKPADVIAFLGVEPGMTVVDVIAAGGYYTEVLSHAVGPEGRVYAQNPPFVLAFREGANEKQMSARLAGDRLANVRRLDKSMGEVALPADSVDFAITALNFHDVYNRDPEVAAGMLAVIRAFLKPGGVLGLIDHAGNAGNDNAELHRIEEEKVVQAVTAAGFEIEATSDLLRNPGDDRSTNVFAPEIRGRTDRFLLKLRKPAS